MLDLWNENCLASSEMKGMLVHYRSREAERGECVPHEQARILASGTKILCNIFRMAASICIGAMLHRANDWHLAYRYGKGGEGI